MSRLSRDGIEAVRVELLARDLGVSKGSFYWHFRDRADLLSRMLARWEGGEAAWLDAAISGVHSPASRWARLVNRSIEPDRLRCEAGLRAWARGDAAVASCLATIEGRRTAYIASILREVGFAPRAADTWAELALLVCLGWFDRATRDEDFRLASGGLAELLSEMILAASDRLVAPNP
ncbi:MAG: TetR/AcrR family transcriptional regulator [Methylocella sp.]